MSKSVLYIACRNGDLDTAQQLLPTLTLDEINQIEANGSTSLHATCYFNHPQIVKLLLDCGAARTTLNKHGCIAFDEAATEQVKGLFSRPFDIARARFSSDTPLDQAIEWVSSINGRYEWQNKEFIGNKDINTAVEGMVKEEQFYDVSNTNKIEYFFSKARQTQDPTWLVRAYSAEMCFCQTINTALALESSLLKGPATKTIHSFVGVLLHHDALKKYRYVGKCFRGMKLSTKDFEENYKIGVTLQIKPFISTSKCRHIA